MNREKLEDIEGIALTILVGFFLLIWTGIKGLFLLLGKFIVAVAKNVYGRIVIAVGGVIFAYLVAQFFHLIQ